MILIKQTKNCLCCSTDAHPSIEHISRDRCKKFSVGKYDFYRVLYKHFLRKPQINHQGILGSGITEVAPSYCQVHNALLSFVFKWITLYYY